MDNIITGAIAVVIFMMFVLGLAESIRELPFVIIVGAVCAMLCIDYFQSAREGLRMQKEKESRTVK
jgi:ABC-type Fe3+-siderophore transport system permease subunit